MVSAEPYVLQQGHGAAEDRRCWESREFQQRKKGAGAEFICSVDRGKSGDLSVHTQQRKIHPMAYREVHLPHPPHCPKSQKASTFNFCFWFFWWLPSMVPGRLTAIMSPLDTMDLRGHKSRFCSPRLCHRFCYFLIFLWLNPPGGYNSRPPPECLPCVERRRQGSLPAPDTSFLSSISPPLSSIYSGMFLRLVMFTFCPTTNRAFYALTADSF